MSDIHYMHLCNVHMHLISRNSKYVYQSVLFKQKSILVLFHFHFIKITFTSSNTLLLLILSMYVSLSTILEKVIKFYLSMLRLRQCLVMISPKSRIKTHIATIANLAKICLARLQKVVLHAVMSHPSPIQIHK